MITHSGETGTLLSDSSPSLPIRGSHLYRLQMSQGGPAEGAGPALVWRRRDPGLPLLPPPVTTKAGAWGTQKSTLICEMRTLGRPSGEALPRESLSDSW